MSQKKRRVKGLEKVRGPEDSGVTLGCVNFSGTVVIYIKFMGRGTTSGKGHQSRTWVVKTVNEFTVLSHFTPLERRDTWSQYNP